MSEPRRDVKAQRRSSRRLFSKPPARCRPLIGRPSSRMSPTRSPTSTTLAMASSTGSLATCSGNNWNPPAIRTTHHARHRHGGDTHVAFWCAARSTASVSDWRSHFLTQAGFTIWLPRYRRAVYHPRPSAVVLRPFFPGYLFSTIAPMARGQDRARWVTRLVMDGERPARVPDRVHRRAEGAGRVNGGRKAIRAVAATAPRRPHTGHRRAVLQAPGAGRRDGAARPGHRRPLPAGWTAASQLAGGRCEGDLSKFFLAGRRLIQNICKPFRAGADLSAGTNDANDPEPK